jgi:hypothetical protein
LWLGPGEPACYARHPARKFGHAAIEQRDPLVDFDLGFPSDHRLETLYKIAGLDQYCLTPVTGIPGSPGNSRDRLGKHRKIRALAATAQNDQRVSFDTKRPEKNAKSPDAARSAPKLKRALKLPLKRLSAPSNH